MTAKVLIAAIAAAVAVGAVSGAMATIPDGAGVIHGCYSTLPNAGQLRVIDTAKVKSCGRNENPLDWNVQGRPGTTGPVGPTGAVGPTGPSGTNQAWFKEASSPAFKDPFTLLSLTLPAGTFMVTLTGQAVDANGDGHMEIQCFVAGHFEIASSVFLNGRAASLASSGVVTLAAPGSLDVTCDADIGLGQPADNIDIGLAAIRLDEADVE